MPLEFVVPIVAVAVVAVATFINLRASRLVAAPVPAPAVTPSAAPDARWTMAVQMLSRRDTPESEGVGWHLAGIVLLEQVGPESPALLALATETLSAYVRQHTSVGQVGLRPTVAVQSALSALARSGRHGLDLRRAVLWGADLQGARFVGAVFTDARLRGARLTDAALASARLDGADLSDADLRGADLSNASLRDARLDGAVLVGAVLRGADLRGASLRGVVLVGAVLDGATLPDDLASPLAARGGQDEPTGPPESMPRKTHEAVPRLNSLSLGIGQAARAAARFR